MVLFSTYPHASELLLFLLVSTTTHDMLRVELCTFCTISTAGLVRLARDFETAALIFAVVSASGFGKDSLVMTRMV